MFAYVYNCMNTVNELSNKTTTISLSKENYNKLKQLGYTSQSFNDVLSRVLKNLREED